jgi:hypothetical protein
MRHRWMAFLPFELTPEDARRMTTGGELPSIDEVPPTEIARGEAPPPDDPRPWFGLHNVVHDLVSVGCYTCEQPYSDEVEAAGCPGEPGQKLAYVDEQGRDLNPNEVMDLRTLPPARLTSVGRNDPCPCGSGLKFKRCHGAPHGS